MILRKCKDALERGYRRSRAAVLGAKTGLVNACLAVALMVVGASSAMAQTAGAITPVDIGVDLDDIISAFGTKLGIGLIAFFGFAITMIVLWKIWNKIKRQG